MKRTIAAVILLISAIIMCSYADNLLGREADALSESLLNIIEISESGTDREVLEKISLLQKQWERSSKIIESFSLHEFADEAGMLISSLDETLKYGSRRELMLRCVDAVNRITGLRNAGKLSTENLL